MAESDHSQKETPVASARTVAFSTPVDSGSANSSRPLRHHTPFRKTPGTRQLRSAATVRQARRQASPGSQVDKPNLEGLTKKSWRLFRVSPLYQFSYQPAALRQYKRFLSLHLEAEQRKGMAVAVDSERADQANISVFQGLACQDDPEAVEFILKQKDQSAGDKVVLTALLCPCQESEESRQTLQKGFTLLPLLLVKGPVSLTNHLIFWIQMQFDCRISPMMFSPVDLSWMVAMWSGFAKEKGNRPVQLVYKVPEEVVGMDRIVLDIDAKDCQELWNCIHPEGSEEFNQDEVERFVRSLEAHFYYHFKIKLSAMPLTQIGTAAAFIGADGRIKIYQEEKVESIIAHLGDLSLERHFK